MRHYLASALVALSSIAHADSRAMSPAAKAHLDRGMTYFATRDFTAAIAAFDRGLAIEPHADFRYAKAQALRLGGDCRAALVEYRAFLGTDPPEAEAALARENVTKCEQMLAATKSEPVGQARRIELWRDVPPPTWWRDPPGIVLAGVGVASLAASAGFALHARHVAGESDQSGDLAAWDRARDTWRRDRIIAGVTLGIGLAAAIGTTARFIWIGRQQSTRVRVGPGDRSASLVVEGTW